LQEGEQGRRIGHYNLPGKPCNCVGVVPVLNPRLSSVFYIAIYMKQLGRGNWWKNSGNGLNVEIWWKTVEKKIPKMGVFPKIGFFQKILKRRVSLK